MIKRAIVLASVFVLASCGSSDGVEGYDALSNFVADNRVGGGSDQWIEMITAMGTSELVGLVFGYMDDHQACLEAVAGMQEANPGRVYVCTPAN